MTKKDEKIDFTELQQYCVEWFSSLLPFVMYDIDTNMKYGERYFYELNIKRYIPIGDSYKKIKKAKKLNKKEVDEFVPISEYSSMGLILLPDYPDKNDETKTKICRLEPKTDGKKICEKLKEMRKSLAEANGIEYETKKCPSKGPCAGTCRQCDKEIEDLQKKLLEIAEKDRIYPDFKCDFNQL